MASMARWMPMADWPLLRIALISSSEFLLPKMCPTPHKPRGWGRRRRRAERLAAGRPGQAVREGLIRCSLRSALTLFSGVTTC